MKAFFSTLLFLILSLPVYGGELPKTLLNLFKGVKTAEITFSQKTFVPVAGNEVTLYRGEIFYKRPLKFLWRYTWGSRMEIVSNGKFLETVFDDGSCQLTPLEGNLNMFPLLLLAESPEEFLKEFKVVSDEKREGVEVVTCVARGKDPFFRKFIFFFKGGRLEGLKAVQSDGTEETFVIEKLKLNIPVKDSLFKLRPCKE